MTQTSPDIEPSPLARLCVLEDIVVFLAASIYKHAELKSMVERFEQAAAAMVQELKAPTGDLGTDPGRLQFVAEVQTAKASFYSKAAEVRRAHDRARGMQ